MSTNDTSSQTNTEQNGPKATNVGSFRGISLKKRGSLKPRKSLLKVRSLRPTRAVIGKVKND
jgi:hypothetical protein